MCCDMGDLRLATAPVKDVQAKVATIMMRCKPGRTPCFVATLVGLCGILVGLASAAIKPPLNRNYVRPPEEIARIFEAPPVPAAVAIAAPGRNHFMLIDEFRPAPSISSLEVNKLDLAGWQIDTSSNSSIGALSFLLFRHLMLYDSLSGHPLPLPNLPEHLGFPLWSPDGDRFALMVLTNHVPTLLIVEPEKRTVLIIKDVWLNTARIPEGLNIHLPCDWSADSRRLLCLAVPRGRGKSPIDEQDTLPYIRDTQGPEAQLKDRHPYEQFLHAPRDERLYDYYMTSQPVMIDAATGRHRAFGPPGIYKALSGSPDSRYFLSVRIEPPYSYETFDNRFPTITEILDARGRLLKVVARSGLDTSGNWLSGNITPGPRQFFWQPTAPATLVYFDALDGGNAGNHASERDSLRMWAAPFDVPSFELFRSKGRMGFWPVRALWGERGLVILEEIDRDANRRRAWKLEMRSMGRPPELLWEYDAQYSNGSGGRGELVAALGPRSGRDWNGESQIQDAKLLQDGDWVYLRGQDSSPEGGIPFLDRFNLRTHQTERLFQSPSNAYHEVISILDPKARMVLLSTQNPWVPPNFQIVDRTSGGAIALTHFTDPQPEITHAARQKIEYQRADGVRLSGTLYFPVGYQPGSRPPLIMEGYPLISKGMETLPTRANRFPSMRTGVSPLPLVTQGYSIFHADMVLTGGKLANETNNEQLAADAKAAVDKLVSLGFADPGRIGIVGHSYGGFMVANLLANTRLFAAGVALSGVYNFTLSPMGFQEETRSYWNAPEVYDQMSPLQHADKIKAPLLLIHGEDDASAAAHTGESVRLYEALESLGSTSRLLIFPHEGHNFRACETFLQTQAEMLVWFDRYLKRDIRTPQATDLVTSARPAL